MCGVTNEKMTVQDSTINAKVFRTIFDRYFDAIRNYIYYRIGDAEAASDMTQDIFMKVWVKREQFYTQEIKSLLYKIAGDSVISYYRKNNTKKNFSESMIVNDSTDVLNDTHNVEELKYLYNLALLKMTDVQRATFLMSRDENRSYKEIALLLDISIKTVEKRMSIALKILRSHIKF